MMKDNTESGDNGDNNPEEMGNIYISSEQIIQEVQKFRCLYDPADPDHKDRDVVRDAWLSVTQAVVGEPWASMNTAEKDEAVNCVKRKWMNMKDALQRSLVKRRFPSLCDGTKRRPYCYYEQMSFLLDTDLKKYVPEGVDIHATYFGRPVDKKKDLSANENSHSRPSTRKYKFFDGDEESSPISVPDTSISESNGTIQRQRVDYLAHRTAHMPQDPDRLFLLSLLPRVSALSSRDKMDFQINIMKLLQEYEIDSKS